MRYRSFGRTVWSISEVGYGMWGMGSWSGSDDTESMKSLDLAVHLGCNFFDTAYAYGNGRSERLLGQLVRTHPKTTLYTATKIPPKNRTWPSQRGFALDDVFPADYIREITEKSLANLGVATIDLIQFHVWEDAWAADKQWQDAIQALKREKMIRAVGVSINRWEPWNVLESLRTGMIDSVQVIYNIFDQAPEDELFPLCEERGIGVIARVPFDEGTLTGSLTMDSRWPEGDWRNSYFVPENLAASVDRAEALKPIVPNDMTMAEMALRFILENKAVSTVIPGMRREKNVRANLGTSNGRLLSPELRQVLRTHRWDRVPAKWSQ